MYFPSLTLFQRADWTSQANLDVSVPGKCFLGWYDETAPDCSDVEPGTTPCQCPGSWDQKVTDFQWHNTTYRSLTLTSTSSMLSTVPTTQMIAQAFFNCKSCQSFSHLNRLRLTVSEQMTLHRLVKTHQSSCRQVCGLPSMTLRWN